MNTTYELAHPINYSTEKKALLAEIKKWMDSNMLLSGQHYIWKIGITTNAQLRKVTGEVRSDFECKHFKYWNAQSFKQAIGIISDLNKCPFIFKSKLNHYSGKGKYVFVYKTPCSSKNLFYHTLHH